MRCCLWYNASWRMNIDIDTPLKIQLNYFLCIGNLSLNQLCTVHEQCSSLNYSRFVEEKCTCMEGYTGENLTHCIKCKVFISYYLHRWSYVMPVITNVIICIIMCKSVKSILVFYIHVINISGKTFCIHYIFSLKFSQMNLNILFEIHKVGD